MPSHFKEVPNQEWASYTKPCQPAFPTRLQQCGQAPLEQGGLGSHLLVFEPLYLGLQGQSASLKKNLE